VKISPIPSSVSHAGREALTSYIVIFVIVANIVLPVHDSKIKSTASSINNTQKLNMKRK